MTDNARFAWLNALPYATRELRWPPDAESSLENRFGDASRTSVLDDRWAYLGYPKASNESWIYFADVAAPEPTHIDIERVAVLQDRVNLLSLCPRGTRAAFVTLRWDEIALSVTLVAHAQDGNILTTRAIPAHAAYRQLVVDGTRVGVCLSTGLQHQDSPINGYPFRGWLVQGISQREPSLSGDQIAIWDWQADTLEIVDLALHGKPHQGSFTFLSSGLALAAMSPPQCGHPYPVLQLLHNTSHNDARSLSFTEGVVKFQSIDADVAQLGSSASSDLVAHAYHTGGHIAIFPLRLLTRLDVEPTTDDPAGLVETWNHPDEVRTLRLRFAGSPNQVGNRLLVMRDPDVNSDDDDEEGEDEEPAQPPIWILDLDPSRLRELTALESHERIALNDELARSGAAVKVITRRFHLDLEGNEEDLEPETGDNTVAAGEAKGGSLVYDEGSAAARDHVGSGCVRIKLLLPASARVGQEYTNLALTASGVLKVPVSGVSGRMYYYQF